MTVLNDGRPVFVEGAGDTDRIGRGAWARWLATSVVRDEGSPRAERGRILARTGYVHSVSVDKGEITALVIGSAGVEYRVHLRADPVPPRVWAAVIGSTRGRTLFEAAAAGREQSLQLEHVMTVDWEEPLIPPSRALRRSCTCPDADRNDACKHVIALGYVVADAIDHDPSILLEWRGCTPGAPAEPGAAPVVVERPENAWAAGPLPALEAPRPLPVGSVLKRLGESGLVVDGVDLRDALQPAYAAFAGAPAAGQSR
jgi:uncharacterized Zn finger protein